MQLIQTDLADVMLVQLDVFSDERGAFAETYDAQKFDDLGLATRFLQDSWSLSRAAGTVRGLHFQLPPHAQDKLVRVTRGRVWDVIVDIRRGSPNFGRHVAVELTADRPLSVFVPKGFAHGFCTLEDNTEVTYKMSDHFYPKLYRGLRWCDRAMAIPWPVEKEAALVSQQDQRHPLLAEFDSPFTYEQALGR